MPRFPFPLNKGDKLRSYQLLKILSQNYSIHLFILNDEKIRKSDEMHIETFTASLTIFNLPLYRYATIPFKWVLSKKPLQALYYENNKALQQLQNLVDEIKPDFLFFQLARLEFYIKNIRHPKKIIDLMDCFSFHYWMRANGSNFLLKKIWESEAEKMRQIENDIINITHHCFIISQRDLQLLPNAQKNNISILMNGVDFIDHNKTRVPVYDLIFFGNLQYQPNIQAIKFMADKILPILYKTHPAITLLIAGANPSKSLQKYLKNKKISVNANPVDRTLVLSSAKIFVGPLFWNTGIQNKILEAIIVGLPTVISNNAAEALNLTNNQTTLTAISEEDFAKNILSLLNDNNLMNTIAERAYEFVKQNYNWKGIELNIKKILKY